MLSWAALTLAVLGAVAVGLGIFHALGHLQFRQPFFEDASVGSIWRWPDCACW